MSVKSQMESCGLYFSPEKRGITVPLKFPHESRLIWEEMHHFEEHGCTISQDDCNVYVQVPAGTTRQEILPRTLEEKNCITFPDGWQIWESRRRHDDVSLVSIPVVRLPEE